MSHLQEKNLENEQLSSTLDHCRNENDRLQTEIKELKDTIAANSDKLGTLDHYHSENERLQTEVHELKEALASKSPVAEQMQKKFIDVVNWLATTRELNLEQHTHDWEKIVEDANAMIQDHDKD